MAIWNKLKKGYNQYKQWSEKRAEQQVTQTEINAERRKRMLEAQAKWQTHQLQVDKLRTQRAMLAQKRISYQQQKQANAMRSLNNVLGVATGKPYAARPAKHRSKKKPSYYYVKVRR